MDISSRLSNKSLPAQQFSSGKTSFCKFQKQISRILGLLILTVAFGVNTQAQTSETQFFQGFETDNSGWVDFTNPAPVRVPSGTDGIIAKTGGFYGKVASGTPNTFTRWGGYSSTFPSRGFTTSVDIYLNM